MSGHDDELIMRWSVRLYGKPRLRRSGGLWVCEGARCGGLGDLPGMRGARTAYSNWRTAVIADWRASRATRGEIIKAYVDHKRREGIWR